MKLNNQKKLAAKIFKGSPKRVTLDTSKLDQIKEAITKFDIKGLISNGVITERPKRGVSRARARKAQEQRKKGRQSGPGSRSGKKTARVPKKEAWMNKIRLQRSFLQELKEKELVEPKVFRDLYRKAKGGFFRSRRHIKIYMTDNNLFSKKE
ncbi:50S ribosomal protein L19e [Candidatus Woesearchaeota archaeon]|nr:MAG: 50S ribosomal protein L19e [Candidatus Woesearchaeota archaeon]